MSKPSKIGRNVISGGVGSRVNVEKPVKVGQRAKVAAVILDFLGTHCSSP
jgi:hypothetical protein